MTRALRRRDDEGGAIAVIMGAAMMAMLLVALGAANAATVTAARRESQRASDLASLAAAANLPLVGILSATEPSTTACGRAAVLLTEDPSPLLNRLAVGAAPRCGSGVTVSTNAVWDTVQTVQTALDSTLNTAGLLNPLMCNPLTALLLDPFLAGLSGTSCAVLRDAIANLPSRLSPALLAPRVTVGVASVITPPVLIPGFGDDTPVATEATARRRFKNVVVVPALPTRAPADLADLNLNVTAAQVRDTVLPALTAGAAALDAAIDPLLPPGVGLNLTDLFIDVRDIYDPPTGVQPPSVLQLAEQAAVRGEPVIVLRAFQMPVLGIPALDFTASYLTPLATPGHFRALPIPTEQLASARGLFGATLVE